MRRRRVAALLALALAPPVSGCVPETESTGMVGEPAPQYHANTLEGDTVTLESLRGRVVLLNVWATWCPPCREEIPELQSLHEELAGEGLRVVGVSIDASAADDVIRAFAREHGMTYSMLHDPGERVSSVFRLHGVPATLLIDRDGVVRWRHLGPVTAEDASLRAALDAAL